MQFNELTAEQRKALRKIKASGSIFDTARTSLKAGIVGNGISGAYIQFGQDCATYGLYEALLYAEGYEQSNSNPAYAKGTVLRTLDLVAAKIDKQLAKGK